jgi:hypothetical protein
LVVCFAIPERPSALHGGQTEMTEIEVPSSLPTPTIQG